MLLRRFESVTTPNRCNQARHDSRDRRWVAMTIVELEEDHAS
jgi:hypothetical protein